MNGPEIIGREVVLRAIAPDDLETLRRWRNRPEYRQYFREYRDISPAMQHAWYERTVLNDPHTHMFAITQRQNGRLLGACGICYIEPWHQSGDFSIYIGADDLYIDGRFAPDAARLLLDYGFGTLNLHRIWAEIYAIDTAKQALLPRLGFRLDGRHRDAHRMEDGRFVDCLFYGLLKGEAGSGSAGLA